MRIVGFTAKEHQEEPTSSIDKIRKLINQADDVAGTPEADAFLNKAFQLMARDGLTEAEVRATTPNTRPADIETTVLNFKGTYNEDRAYLTAMILIAMGAHCNIGTRSAGTAKFRVLKIYATAATTTRGIALATMVERNMLQAVAKYRPEGTRWDGTPIQYAPATIAKRRREFMRGYTNSVHNRLWDAQETAKETATPGAALVLASDRDRAAAAAKAADPKATRYKKTHRWTSASEAGAQAGNKVNLGGTHIGGNTTRALA